MAALFCMSAQTSFADLKFDIFLNAIKLKMYIYKGVVLCSSFSYFLVQRRIVYA